MIGLEQVPRYRRLVERIFGAEEIVPPGIVVENDPFEYRAMREVFSFSAYKGLDPAATDYGIVGVSNPNPQPAQSSGPALLVVVERVTIINAEVTNDYFQIRVAANLSWSVSSTAMDARDLRLARGSQARAVVHAQTTEPGNLFKQICVLAGDSQQVPGPWLLRPGVALLVLPNTKDTRVKCSFEGYEWVARPEERIYE